MSKKLKTKKFDLFSRKSHRTQRLIDYLREKYPEYVWQYEPANYWCASINGQEIGYVSHVASLAPRYDGDDDTFVTSTWFYREGKVPECVWLF